VGGDLGPALPRVIGQALLPERRHKETPSDAGTEAHWSLTHGEWVKRFPGLDCGITPASAGDYGLGRNDHRHVVDVYGSLGSRLGFGLVAVGRQVHGTDVRVVAAGPDSIRHPEDARSKLSRLLVVGELDGLVTGDRGVLLASTAADCVPAYLVDPVREVIGLAHAGWRGTALGVLSRGVDAMCDAGAMMESLHVHLGPAICGTCYEVDAPVLEAFDLEGNRAHLDLRGVLSEQARQLGVPAEQISASAWCTRCSDGLLHSHRGGGRSAGRMAAYIGLRQVPMGP
jgi:YfiH family protein